MLSRARLLPVLPLIAHILREDADLLTRWRARLTAAFLVAVATLGVLVAIPMITMGIARGFWPLVMFDASALAVTYALLLSHRVSNRARAVFLTGASFGLGVFSVVTRGPGSTVLGWLFMSAFLSAFLLGPRVTAGVVVGTLAVLGGVAVAIARDWVWWAHGDPLVLNEWLLTSLNFAFLIIVFAVANGLIIRLLENEDRARSAAERQLRQARHNEALGTLAGGIAHDFNNLLVPVLANVEAVRALVPRGSEADSALADAERSANRARELVQRILTFGRGLNAQRVPIDPAQAARDAVELARLSLGDGVRIALQVEHTPPVRASATELHQVLANLVTNAVHAVGTRGAIVVTVDTQLEGGRPWVRLMVRDNGVGMDGPTRERLFDPYFSTKAPGRGTGLGLPIVQSVVLSLGGTVQVESAPQQGTTFTVRLPALDPPAESAPSALAAPDPFRRAPLAPTPLDPTTSAARVLLVDDEPSVRRAAARVLESIGCTVTTAASASEALAQLQVVPLPFDVLVTDFRMPEMSGVDLVAAIAPALERLPIVLISGHLDAARAEGHLPERVVLLAKPFTRAALADALATAVREAAAYRD